MSKKCRLVTTSMAAIRAGKSQRGMMDAGLELIDSVAGYKPDLICFPEGFLRSGGDRSAWEEINAETERRFGEKAAELGCYIMFSIYEPAEIFEGYKYNTELIYDRSGKCVLRYHKRHTVYGETTVSKVLPGREIPIAETDFGRVACLTCFDIGWRGDWQTLSDMGAELVVWPSAYHGGNLLNAYAAVHMYYVVSSVWNAECRIIDPFGNDIAESTIWDPCAIGEVYLGSEIFHFDHHTTLIPQLRREYGERIHLRIDGRGNMFELASRDPELKVSDIKAKFGMSNYREYHAVSTADNIEYLGRYPEK